MSRSASSSSPRIKSSAKSPGDSSGREQHANINDAEAPFPQPVRGGLHRGLSARQVQMIAIAGTIGTGLFLGTGRSLAQGGPASILICYGIVGFIVYVTLGRLTAYATRFFSPSYGFALSWNYWFNDAVSVASDLTAAQLVLQFWTTSYPWVVSLLFWVFLVSINASHVKAYGELEYWLSFLKVATIVIFIIVGILVNVGVNESHTYIGTQNWYIPGAPFVGGFGGFAKVFVTASFAYGGTESLGITAGETKNPSQNMPKILLFYILSILLIGLNVPWDYPNLSNKTTTTSPFTIVFTLAGSTVAASFMNTVILTSVLSAGNHALFAGTRVLYGLSVVGPVPHAPRIFSRTTRAGVPLYALLATSSISVLCLSSSYIGSGQIAWLSIGLASWRFRKAWIKAGSIFRRNEIITVIALILIQGWSSIIPTFSPVDFVSYYIEIPIMVVMGLCWVLAKNTFIDSTPVPGNTPLDPPNETTS
ncbi:amino acid permease/ SLC12A domain-containing protein [Suillus subalutaceus]|uniref:amino acid permease/ SLC12A domain-containing protein n=1 Tax=Suillus subalutaceus TaxID=48586 RepID=UPI001B87B710|nr:amino acid permease/ SLC12A domain-containing protein [Suillus subalutaceus]KAG1865858.1 amino acid permease/ SLC12A domain-containing protein [Suillus subalutaceus]